MSRISKQVIVLGLSSGIFMSAVLGAGFSIGWFSRGTTDSASQATDGIPQDILLRAASASGGKSMAMATGQIDENVEGLFVLDYTSGNLFCWVIDRRGGGFLGQFQTNVRADFGPIEQGRTPDYVMVTGFLQTAGGAVAQGQPARCVCYVADSNTGVVVGYSLLWSRTRQQQSQPQQGALVKVANGIARDNSVIRE